MEEGDQREVEEAHQHDLRKILETSTTTTRTSTTASRQVAHRHADADEDLEEMKKEKGKEEATETETDTDKERDRLTTSSESIAEPPKSSRPRMSASLSSLFDITKKRARKAHEDAVQVQLRTEAPPLQSPQAPQPATPSQPSQPSTPLKQLKPPIPQLLQISRPSSSPSPSPAPSPTPSPRSSSSKQLKPLQPKSSQVRALHLLPPKQSPHRPHFTSRATRQRRGEVNPYDSHPEYYPTPEQTRSLGTSGGDIRFRGHASFFMEDEYKHMFSRPPMHRYPTEPPPPSARARQAFHMETPEDEMLGYTSVTEDEMEEERDSITLEHKQNMINQLFGMIPFPPLFEEHPEGNEAELAPTKPSIVHTICAVLWHLFGGCPLYVAYSIVGGLMNLTGVGKDYGAYCFRARAYVFNPFGKYFIRSNPAAQLLAGESVGEEQTKSTALLKPINLGMENNSVAYYIWIVLASIFLTPLHIVYVLVAWLFVVIAPLSKMNLTLVIESYRKNNVTSLDFVASLPPLEERKNIIFGTDRAGDSSYLSYSLMGVNIIFLNSLFIVVLTIFLGYVLPLLGAKEPHFLVIFILSTISIIPVSYYIGLAISSLSVQSSFAAGAILNASFGSFIELVLYTSAIRAGTLPGLVQASITGTLLGMLLLLPGLSMIAGGIRYKQQRFNRAATGVSTTLLLISVVGAFTPTIFHSAYGKFVMKCDQCEYIGATNAGETLRNLDCDRCSWVDDDLLRDPLYLKKIIPLQIAISLILPLAYIAGCVFTLKTHSHIYNEKVHEEEEQEGGHKSPGWSRRFSIAVLVIFAITFGLISEELVESLSPVLDLLDIPPRFAGLVFVALITSTVEFLNAIIFAYHNDLTLAFEVANSYCVQVALLQMPALVFISLIVNHYQPDNLAFTLLFPMLDLFAVILALLIMIFSSSEGKSNYFQGLSLVFIYVIFVTAFFFVPTDD